MVLTCRAVSCQDMMHNRREGGYANGKGRELLDDGLVEYEIREFRPPVVEPEACTLLVLDICISFLVPLNFYFIRLFSFSLVFFAICNLQFVLYMYILRIPWACSGS